eukprot:scaffold56464_cov20-Tisochrysis_lutea.AAC.2
MGAGGHPIVHRHTHTRTRTHTAHAHTHTCAGGGGHDGCVPGAAHCRAGAHVCRTRGNHAAQPGILCVVCKLVPPGEESWQLDQFLFAFGGQRVLHQVMTRWNAS